MYTIFIDIHPRRITKTIRGYICFVVLKLLLLNSSDRIPRVSMLKKNREYSEHVNIHAKHFSV